MTYYNLVQYINDKIVAYYPTGTTVQFTEGYVELLNDNANDYPAFHLVLDETVQTSNSITYNLELYYVDILLEDRSNRLLVKSDGIEILKSIIASIDVDTNNSNMCQLVVPIRYIPYDVMFSDLCAGDVVKFALMYNNDTHCD